MFSPKNGRYFHPKFGNDFPHKGPVRIIVEPRILNRYFYSSRGSRNSLMADGGQNRTASLSAKLCPSIVSRKRYISKEDCYMICQIRAYDVGTHKGELSMSVFVTVAGRLLGTDLRTIY